MFVYELFESKSNPSVVFVLGAASQGKSSVADKVIEEEFGFTLMDLDRPADHFRNTYGISDSIPDMTDDEKEKQKQRAELRKQGKLPPAPKMADFDDPEEYIKAMPQDKLRPHHAAIAAGEVIKRSSQKAIENRENLVFVETGGKAGMKKRIDQFHELGYDVYCVFVAISPEANLNDEETFNKILNITLERQKARKRQLDPSIVAKALKQSQKTKEKVLPLFDKVATVDTGKLDMEGAAQRTREIMTSWGF